MTETYTVDDKEQFLQGLSKLWHKYPEMTFGALVIQVYCGLNTHFSQFAFVKQDQETWDKCLEGIMETENVS